MTKKPDDELEALMGGEPKVQLDPSGLLTNEEVQAAKDAAKVRVMKERRLAALATIEAQETERLRIEDGLTTGIGAMDEIVNITIDLPPYTEKISLNGPLGSHYYQGKTYPVPRHVADTLADQMFRCWRHEDQTEGKDLTSVYRAKRGTAINAVTRAVTNAPARVQ